MKEEKTGEKLSSVAISHTYSESLAKLCKRFGVTKKEFVELSISYFSRPGRDPRDGNEDAMLERLGSLEQTLKRFQSDWHASKNSWEKSYLKPAKESEVEVLRLLQVLHNSEVEADMMGMQMMLFAFLLAPQKQQLANRLDLLNRLGDSLNYLPFDDEFAEKVRHFLLKSLSVQDKF